MRLAHSYIFEEWPLNTDDLDLLSLAAQAVEDSREKNPNAILRIQTKDKKEKEFTANILSATILAAHGVLYSTPTADEDDLEKARDLFTTALEHEPRMTEISECLVNTYLDLYDRDSAIEVAEAAVEANPCVASRKLLQRTKLAPELEPIEAPDGPSPLAGIFFFLTVVLIAWSMFLLNGRDICYADPYGFPCSLARALVSLLTASGAFRLALLFGLLAIVTWMIESSAYNTRWNEYVEALEEQNQQRIDDSRKRRNRRKIPEDTFLASLAQEKQREIDYENQREYEEQLRIEEEERKEEERQEKEAEKERIKEEKRRAKEGDYD
ncbi:MAG: hypothetical protein ABL962_08125 [Fimbriimonadaceae bacterium]